MHREVTLTTRLKSVREKKLTMQKHVSRTCKQINIKLFSIKRLFYLCNSVKLQFFKTFLLPYFDYCLSLSIYFTKSVLQKLSNCFYICLHKLFKFNFSGYEQREINSFLCKYGLFGLEHRLVYKLLHFSYNIVNGHDSPALLKDSIKINAERHADRNLRNKNKFDTTRNCTKFGDKTFKYFFPRLINFTCQSFINESRSIFNSIISNNINTIFDIITKNFSFFDLKTIYFYSKNL